MLHGTKHSQAKEIWEMLGKTVLQVFFGVRLLSFYVLVGTVHH